jgi:hypothetical protein
MSKEFQRYLRAAKDQGWIQVPTRKGMQLVPPDPGRPIVQVHKTPSDHRALRNLLAEMRRSGFVWPPPR